MEDGIDKLESIIAPKNKYDIYNFDEFGGFEKFFFIGMSINILLDTLITKLLF